MKKIFILFASLTLVLSTFLFFVPTTKAETSTSLTATADTVVNKAAPTTNYGNSATMSISYNTATGMEQRSLIKFNTSSIPAGSQIQSATVNLYVITTSGAALPVIYFQRITQDWGETTVNWSNKPTSAGNSAPFTIGSAMNTTIDFDVTTMVQGWFSGTPNYGFYLTQDTGITFSRTFLTRETATPPKLVISFTLPSGGNVTPPKTDTTSTIAEPKNLEASLSTDEKNVKLTWDASITTKIDGYKIFRKEKEQDKDMYSKIGDVDKNIQEFEDKDAKAGKEYNYVARTYKDDKESENSNEVSIKLPQSKQAVQNQEPKETPWYKDWMYLLPIGLMFAAVLGLLIYYLVTRKKNKNKDEKKGQDDNVSEKDEEVKEESEKEKKEE